MGFFFLFFIVDVCISFVVLVFWVFYDFIYFLDLVDFIFIGEERFEGGYFYGYSIDGLDIYWG